VHPEAAYAAYANPIALKPSNLLLLDDKEAFYVDAVTSYVGAESTAASLQLSRQDGDPAVLARLRALAQLAQEAITCLEHDAPPPSTPSDQCSPAEQVKGGALLFFAAQHAVLLASVARAECRAQRHQAALGDFQKLFSVSLQRPGLPGAAAQLCDAAGFVQDLALEYGELLRCVGRLDDAQPPLRFSASAARAAGDAAGEAAAQGTLSTVLLSRGATTEDLEAAEAASRREVALLAQCSSDGSVEMARARGQLANVLHMRSRALLRYSPGPIAALRAEVAALVDAVLRVAEGARGDELAQVASGAHALRGHLASDAGDKRSAIKHYERVLDIAAEAPSRDMRALATSPAIAPLAMLEQAYAELAREGRLAGDAAASLRDGGHAARYRTILYEALGSELPTECAICSEPLHAGKAESDIHTTKCIHSFHDVCVKRWLSVEMGKGSCPVCRAWVISELPETVEALTAAAQAFSV